jgi:hypothetical protein
MATFAVLGNENAVINVIVAESKEDAENVTEKTCIPCESTSQLGHIWNGTEFIAPEVPPVEE